MSALLDFKTRLEVHYCVNCSMPFAAPIRFFEERRTDGAAFYCPMGHGASYSEREIDRLKKQLEQEQRTSEWWRVNSQSKDKQIHGLNVQVGKVKAKLRRTEVRVSNGVCPCCHRSFVGLARHMKKKHPDYVEGGSE